MSTLRRIDFLLVCCLALAAAGCGESESAKRLGAQPKQTVDRVTTDLDKAMQQEAQRMREAEEKK